MLRGASESCRFWVRIHTYSFEVNKNLNKHTYGLVFFLLLHPHFRHCPNLSSYLRWRNHQTMHNADTRVSSIAITAKVLHSSIFIPIYNVLHPSPLVLPCLNGSRMVARQSLGEHKPGVTTWQPKQTCGRISSMTYRVLNPSGISHSSPPCAKGKARFLLLMLQRHNHKAYLDALQRRTGCAPRHLTQISSEGTAGQDTES